MQPPLRSSRPAAHCTMSFLHLHSLPLRHTSRFTVLPAVYPHRRPLRPVSRAALHSDAPSKPHTPAPLTSSTTRPRSLTRDRDTIKRKVALFIAYEGSRYHGFQRNRGVHTVSDDLEAALHAARAISDDNIGALGKIQWQVAARTDRGVSAAGNLVSAKLLFARDEFADGTAFATTVKRVNASLPASVRVLGVSSITRGFSARQSCGARWYEYFLPLSVIGEDDGDLARFDDIVRRFRGAHAFHNYTVGVDHAIPPRAQAQRIVLQTTCDLVPAELPVGRASLQGAPTRWARVRVRGQSFMLHQIRKMISMAIQVQRGLVPSDAIERSLRRDVLTNVPPAPAVGLFLDCCQFGWYNERHKLDVPLNVHEFEKERELFKSDVILPSIADSFADGEQLRIFFQTVADHPVQLE